MKRPLLLSVVGYSNSGKTSFIENLVSHLKKRGYKVGYIKHDPEGHGITDKENSDTYRLKPLSDITVLFSNEYITLWEKNEYDIFGFVEKYMDSVDFVILEGFKGIKEIPKIVLGDLNVENVLLRIKGDYDIDDIINKLEELRNDKSCTS